MTDIYFEHARLAAMLEGKTVFTKIDLIWGFHHIPVNKVDIPKTAVVTLFGLFEFLFMALD